MATTLVYGNQGSGLGVEQQIKLNKLMTAKVNQQTIFDKFATLTYGLNQGEGTKINFKKWIPMKDLVLANKLYQDQLTSDAYRPGQAIYSMVEEDLYKQFILQEGESGTEFGQMKKVEQGAEIFRVGSWMTVTEELVQHDDMYTISENINQYKNVVSLIIDGFYRDLYRNGAGHHQDITGNDAGHNDVTDSEFTAALKTVSTQLRISGVPYVDEVISSNLYEVKTSIWAKYVGYCNPLVINKMEDNADWKPLEQYASMLKGQPLPGERGMIGDVRMCEEFNMYATADEGEVLIFGKDSTAQIPFKGSNGIEIVTKGFGDNGNDPLNRRMSIGWKSVLGASVINPENLAKVKAKY